MKFCKFLKIMNCYIGQEKSQYDFMYDLFSKVVCEPFSEEDVKKDEEDNDTIDTQLKAESLSCVQSGEATNQEVLLLEETSNTCPVCGCQLLRSKKNNVIKRYKVVKIFPDNLDRKDFLVFSKVSPVNGRYDSAENLITLCTDCALDYEADTTLDEFKELIRIKKTLSQQRMLQQSLESVDIEEEISLVISALVETSSEKHFVDLGLQALCIKQKIDWKYGLLINEISNNVVREED